MNVPADHLFDENLARGRMGAPPDASSAGTVRVLVLRSPGTNCDLETARAFALAGGRPELLHVNTLLRRERALGEFDILALPGGFSYGDDLGAGTVLANQLRCRLWNELEAFVEEGRPVIGICNGFQVLVRLGLLPGWRGPRAASLAANLSGKFEDRWVRLGVESRKSIFLDPAQDGGTEPLSDTYFLPVAHGEGRFVVKDRALLERLREKGQIALTYRRWEDGEPACGRYPDNPNGSMADIAGITNEAGNVLGLMPHPERFVSLLTHPCWTRARSGAAVGPLDPEPPLRERAGLRDSPKTLREVPLEDLERAGDGMAFFRRAVASARRLRKGSRG